MEDKLLPGTKKIYKEKYLTRTNVKSKVKKNTRASLKQLNEDSIFQPEDLDFEIEELSERLDMVRIIYY